MEYTKLEYIESTGTQYINTGIYPTSTSFKAEIQYKFTRTTGPGSNREAWVFGIWNGNSGWRCGCSGTSLNNVGSGFTFDNTLSTDKTIATSNACTATSSSYQVVLFGQGESGGPGHISDSLFRIYYCKIWNGDALVRDFIPCEYNGKIGLWDRVSETFFANNGTGEFIAGPTIGPKTLKVKMLDKNNLYKKLEYIESTSTQYINTGVKFTTGFSCDIKFNMLSTNGDIDILSSAQNDNYLLVSYLNGTPRIYLNGASRNITMPYNTVHTVNMNYNGSTLTYTVDNTTTYTVSKSNATANSNLLLFARSSSYGFSKAVLYYCKIWNGNILVRDLIPVEKASDNTICLYDLVSNTFLENSGTREFAAGPYSLIGKTVSKINGKYAKTINGFSVQCWKKKENPGPHDNILIAGTYIWVDSLGSFSGSLSSNFNFTSDSESFDGIFLSKNGNVIEYMQDGSAYEVYSTFSGGWRNSYNTIVLNTNQLVDSSFYDWAITEGNLVYKGS